MSRFIQRFEKHPLHGVLKDSFIIIDELIDREGNQADALVELDRMKQVCLMIKGALDNCDPNLVYIGHLDGLQTNCLNNVTSYLISYRNDPNLSYLESANVHLDNYIPTIAGIMMPIFPTDVDGARESIVSLRRSISQHLRHVEEEFKMVVEAKNEIEKGISEVASTVESQKIRLDTAIADFQQQFSQAEEYRRNQFSEAEVERVKDYNSREKDWVEKFKTLIESAEKAFAQFIEKSQENEKNLHNQSTIKVNQYIETLEEYKNKAAKTLTVISNSSMAGGYQEVANQEQKSRKFWRVVTMVSMIALVGASIFGFLHPMGDGAIWAEIAKRVSVAATFATVAGYASRQAKVHLDTERLYRRMELELTSLSPYLVELEDNKRQEVLARMAEQFFGKANSEYIQSNVSPQNQEINGGNMELTKLLENILPMVKK